LPANQKWIACIILSHELCVISLILPEITLDSINDLKHIVIHNMLGEFEYCVIAACQQLGEAAYGAAIAARIEQTTGRNCSAGALYLTLDRLESKGLIRTHLGEPTQERGGRAKRMVIVTAEGIKSAAEFYKAITKISKGIRWEVSTHANCNLVADQAI